MTKVIILTDKYVYSGFTNYRKMVHNIYFIIIISLCSIFSSVGDWYGVIYLQFINNFLPVYII